MMSNSAGGDEESGRSVMVLRNGGENACCVRSFGGVVV